VIARAASLYTDPFIMLSGLLTTYSFVGRLNKTGSLDIRNEYLSRLLRYGSSKAIVHILSQIVNRLENAREEEVSLNVPVSFHRLVPTLAALMLLCVHIIPYTGSGPQWPLVVTKHADICKNTWWRNFLFIHNYFGFENIVSKTRNDRCTYSYRNFRLSMCIR
jgi:peptidoglycan/LPS O-acetylase OafA/YrhL